MGRQQMLRRTRIIGALAVIVLGLIAPPALAEGKHGKHVKHEKHQKHRAYNFLGTVSSIAVTDGAGTMTFTPLRGNKAARDWAAAHPGDVTVNVAPETRFRGPADLGRSAADYRVGDGVRVLAFEWAGALNAKRVGLALQAYRGTIVSYDGATMSVNWTDANEIADAWLAAHANPNPVSATITSTTRVEREGDGTPQAGDAVKFRARPSVDGTTLDAVTVEAEASEPEPSPAV